MSFPDVNRSGPSSHLKKKKRLIHESHPQENETFASTLSNFHAQIAYCLRTEALVVLSISSISSIKSNRSKMDEH